MRTNLKSTPRVTALIIREAPAPGESGPAQLAILDLDKPDQILRQMADAMFIANHRRIFKGIAPHTLAEAALRSIGITFSNPSPGAPR